jgi:gliding motility-associated-like protein
MDWIMWPYNSSTCSDIFNNTLPPVTCNWNGACLGFTGCAAVPPAGASPFDFQPPVNANAGDQFIVCFSNYSGQQNLVVPMSFFGSAQVSCYSTVFVCPGSSTQISGLVGVAGSTYNWTPTTGIIGSSTTSTITVQPGSTTVYECITTQPNATILDTMIQVSIHVPATLAANTVLETCQGANDASITVTPNGSAPFTYTINGNAAPNGNFTGLGDGNYLIAVTDDNGCVSDTTITVAPGPICCIMTVSAVSTQASCIGSCDGTGTGNFIDNNGTPTFVWFDSNGNPIGQTTQTATGLCAGDYSVEITDPGLCTFTANITITEGTSMNIGSITVIDPLCFNDCNATLLIAANGATNFSIDNGVTFFPSGNFANLCSGLYRIVVENPLGCSGDSLITIANPPAVIADFTLTPEVTTIENTLIRFINSSLNQTDNFWDFDSLGTSTLLNPSFEFPSETPGTYTTCLAVSNANGCADTLCKSVIINDGLLYYIPNAFTPDGDGINDIFLPILNNFDPESYELFIFNRWGELIFQSESFFTGWDGFATKGPVTEKVKNDVYVWKIKGKDMDTNKKIELIGHISVIK